jgi:acyl dehydratase
VALLTEEARGWATRPLAGTSVVVTRRDILEFSRAIGEDRSIHVDHEAARAAGHPDLVAHPYFPYTIRVAAGTLNGDLAPDGSSADEVPPVETTRAMAGETAVEFGEPVHAGDVVRLERRIVDIYEKDGRSGPLVFVVVDYTFTNQDGVLVMAERFTRIYR